MLSGIFPPEVINDILSRLPVKSLLRFKCVSKPWLSLIESLDFIECHLQHSLKTQTNLTIFVKAFNILRMDNFDPLNEPATLTPPHLPQECDGVLPTIRGSCNGLVVLFNNGILLWNPSTRKYARLPESPKHSTDLRYFTYGFGYDAVKDSDYKFVKIVHCFGDVEDNEVMVFSLKNWCWKKTESFPYAFRYCSGDGAFVGNALHWIAFRDPDSDTGAVAVSFDMGSEKFSEVPLPLPLTDEWNARLTLGVLRGCLVLFCEFGLYFEVWLMEDYNVQESWVKLIGVGGHIIRDFGGPVQPLVYSKCGNKILLDHKDKYMWFNLKTNQERDLRLDHDIPWNFGSCVCIESLVPLDGDGASGSNGKNTKEKRKQPKHNDKKKKRDNKKRDEFLSSGFNLVL